MIGRTKKTVRSSDSRQKIVAFGIFILFVVFMIIVGFSIFMDDFSSKTLSQTSQTAKTTNLKLMVIIFNPVIESKGGQKLNRVMNWPDPDVNTQGVIDDLEGASHGKVDFQIVSRVEVDGFPKLKDGSYYNEDEYINWMKTGVSSWTNCEQSTIRCADLYKIISDYQIAQKVKSLEIDEVFLWVSPKIWQYESVMAGPGAYWINGGPLPGVDSGRVFVLMQLNYQRGVPEALESFGHRTEFIMDRIYCGSAYCRKKEETHPWNRFMLRDQDLPQKGGIGNVHDPVNSDPAKSYDRANTRYVLSNADEWYNYPATNYDMRRNINCFEWGCNIPGNDTARGYLKWWYDHIPHAGGASGSCLNNWWEYIAGVDTYKNIIKCETIPVPSGGGSPSPSPTPPTTGGTYKQYTYLYMVSDNHLSFVLWGQLEDMNDSQIYSKPTALCKETPPQGTNYNYCFKSP